MYVVVHTQARTRCYGGLRCMLATARNNGYTHIHSYLYTKRAEMLLIYAIFGVNSTYIVQ